MKNKEKGFTLVELLAVIVILAIILVIAVPKVMSVIEDSKKATLESTAKMIASQAEKQKVQNTVLGKDDEITCKDITNINDVDYASCSIDFEDSTAKVTISGSGKFEGLWVCNGDKINAIASEEECPFACKSNEVEFIESATIANPYMYEVGDSDSCISYLKDNVVELWPYLTETEVANMCTKEENANDFDELINVLVAYNRVTVKQLLGNGVLKGNVVKKCVSKNNAVVRIQNEYDNEETREENGLIMDDSGDDNIRYAGSNPNNYVYFNCKDQHNRVYYGDSGYNYEDACEVWQIIGVFDVAKTIGGTTEKRIKIVRDEFTDSEGNEKNMKWDFSSETINNGDGINEWSQSDIKNILNGYYLGESSMCTYFNGVGSSITEKDCSNDITPLSTSAQDMIEQAVWSTRGIERKSYTAKEMYEAENTSTLTGKECSATNSEGSANIECNDSVERKAEWEGKIGLIYPSDWGYASTDVNCTDITDEYGTCYQNNWLYHHGYWTILPMSYPSSATLVWLINVGGYYGEASRDESVRPTTYLKSDIQIIDGSGTEDSPYILK